MQSCKVWPPSGRRDWYLLPTYRPVRNSAFMGVFHSDDAATADPRSPAHMGYSFGSACAASSASYGASCFAADHPLADALDKDMRDSVREWDCGSPVAGNDAAAGNEQGPAPGQATGNAKSVSFNLPHKSQRHPEVLDRSAGGASAASNASTASGSSSSTCSDSSWIVYGGLCARRRPEEMVHCPGCGKQTLGEHGGAGMVRFLSSSPLSTLLLLLALCWCAWNLLAIPHVSRVQGSATTEGGNGTASRRFAASVRLSRAWAGCPTWGARDARAGGRTSTSGHRGLITRASTASSQRQHTLGTVPTLAAQVLRLRHPRPTQASMVWVNRPANRDRDRLQVTVVKMQIK
jgi:hypothetical protein